MSAIEVRVGDWIVGEREELTKKYGLFARRAAQVVALDQTSGEPIVQLRIRTPSGRGYKYVPAFSGRLITQEDSEKLIGQEVSTNIIFSDLNSPAPRVSVPVRVTLVKYLPQLAVFAVVIDGEWRYIRAEDVQHVS